MFFTKLSLFMAVGFASCATQADAQCRLFQRFGGHCSNPCIQSCTPIPSVRCCPCPAPTFHYSTPVFQQQPSYGCCGGACGGGFGGPVTRTVSVPFNATSPLDIIGLERRISGLETQVFGSSNVITP